jgi:hypothetical protein
MRGLLTEFGIVIARSADRLRAALPQLIGSDSLPAPLQPLLLEALEQLRAIDARLARCDAEVASHARCDSAAQRLRQVLGIGPLTSSALPAAVADARAFRNARRFSAWLGITPSQHSSGGKTRLGRSTRRGNAYLRTLLVQGAHSTLQAALRTAPAKATHLQRWIVALHQRKGYHKTLVAIANKHARIAWVLLARGENLRPQRLAARLSFGASCIRCRLIDSSLVAARHAIAHGSRPIVGAPRLTRRQAPPQCTADPRACAWPLNDLGSHARLLSWPASRLTRCNKAACRSAAIRSSLLPRARFDRSFASASPLGLRAEAAITPAPA